MDYINAFWVGGLICALVQILLDKTKMLPGRVMVLLVCTGAVLGAVGIYEPFLKFCRRRSQRTAAWLWKCTLERSGESRHRKRLSGNFYGRFYCKCSRNQCCPCLWISGQSDL